MFVCVLLHVYVCVCVWGGGGGGEGDHVVVLVCYIGCIVYCHIFLNVCWIATPNQQRRQV